MVHKMGTPRAGLQAPHVLGCVTIQVGVRVFPRGGKSVVSLSLLETFQQDLRLVPVPTPSKFEREAKPILRVWHVVYFILLLYLFFFSIELMSAAFRMGGRGFAEQLLNTAADPVAGPLPRRAHGRPWPHRGLRPAPR